MSDDILADSIGHLLADCCTPQQVRAIESGASAAELWQAIRDSGFADAMVPEGAGGAGLDLAGALPVVLACGRHALPLPLAQTMAVRAFLAEAGVPAPPGPIAFALAEADGALHCAAVPYGMTADWALLQQGDDAFLLPVTASSRTHTGVFGSLQADLAWPQLPPDALRLPARTDWRALGACLFAAQLAGAMESVFNLTLAYANGRVQFGRPIGKFQAIQHQISVMAEHVSAARMAAQLGTAGAGWAPRPLAAAVAKSRASEAVPAVATLAHAVHGAIGITEEYDLQLHTRRLHEWRRDFGTEAWWNQRIGATLAASGAPALGFIREQVFAA